MNWNCISLAFFFMDIIFNHNIGIPDYFHGNKIFYHKN